MGALNSAPPLPSNLQPAPSASLGALAGPQGPASGTPAGGGASLQSAVVEKLMFAEKALQDAASIAPQLNAVVDAVISQLRSGAGKVLVSLGQDTSGGGGGTTGTPVAPAPPIMQGGS